MGGWEVAFRRSVVLTLYLRLVESRKFKIIRMVRQWPTPNDGLYIIGVIATIMYVVMGVGFAFLQMTDYANATDKRDG